MKKLRFGVAAILMICIFAQPETAVQSAQRAMYVWYASIAPSLFPFLALMPLITDAQACRFYNAAFGRVMQPVFRLPGSAAPAVVIGMLAGSPGGAIGICRIAGEAGMKKSEARRIALALGGVSPAYLAVGIGALMFGSAQLGYRLALIQAIVQLLLLFLLGRIRADGDEALVEPQLVAARNPIRSAVESVLAVAGYMIVFSIAGNLLSGIAGETVGALLSLAIDLPSGVAELANLDIFWKLPALSAAIGFGGLCIAMQNMDALAAIGISRCEYLCVRMISAMVSGGLALVVLREYVPSPSANLRNLPNVYGIYILIVLIFSLPALGILSKNLFLNKSKRREITP